MLARRAFRLLVSFLAVAAILRCGAGVSEDPLAQRPNSITGNLKNVGATCKSGAECASTVCLPDVERTARCCEADCIAQGRVCSALGECVCGGDTREDGGRCLLVEGQRCLAASDCASKQCADGVCCDSACDGTCERCDAPRQAGLCVLHGEDTACTSQTGYVCTARNRCRLPNGLTCGDDADCDSDHCEPGQGQQVCCAQACDGVCQQCSASGACDGTPGTDIRCPIVESCEPDTRCRTYERPPPNACGSHGECAECKATNMLAGTSCGVGAQCDGAGKCIVTGVGQVAAGVYHTCAITRRANVRCWGSNANGQLGAAFALPLVGDVMGLPPANVPDLEIDFGDDVEQIAAGAAHTCALLSTGKVRCWGGALPTLLGTADIALNDQGFVDPLLTGEVQLQAPAVQISTASYHTCALLNTGKVSCWGSNDRGQCGVGSTTDVVALPDQRLPIVDLGKDLAREVRAGARHTCALLEDGSVTCWGSGAYGQLGYGNSGDQWAPPEAVPLSDGAVAIATGSRHTCALLVDGTLRCWGDNEQGQLGYGHPVSIGLYETPLQAETLPEQPGSSNTLGGAVQVWGRDGGILQIVTIGDPSELDAIPQHATCALHSNRTVRCWGSNGRGELGYGYTENPLLVPGATNATSRTPDELAMRPGEAGRFYAGGDLSLDGPVQALADNGRCALMQDGKLFCWGPNEHAELGQPGSYPTSSETRLPSEMGPVQWEPPASAMSVAPGNNAGASGL
jgi:alpha-tubulin suppressor-like RCC1 family protein